MRMSDARKHRVSDSRRNTELSSLLSHCWDGAETNAGHKQKGPTGDRKDISRERQAAEAGKGAGMLQREQSWRCPSMQPFPRSARLLPADSSIPVLQRGRRLLAAHSPLQSQTLPTPLPSGPQPSPAGAGGLSSPRRSLRGDSVEKCQC